MKRTLVHISDLHVGRDASTDEAARRLCASLLEEQVDLVLLTGDVTHRGRREELRLFEAIFAPFLYQDRLILVPGNHDRMGDDVAAPFMGGKRVEIVRRAGLFIVQLDSTALHNRSPIASHGIVSRDDITGVAAALGEAPPGALSILMLHHHVLPLPEDRFTEKVSNFLGWPYAAELPLGRELLARIGGKCDLVLHGHRHKANELHFAAPGRLLRIYNAGSSGVLGWVRHIVHDEGAILSSSWIETGRPGKVQRLPAQPAAENAAHTAGERAAASPLIAP